MNVPFYYHYGFHLVTALFSFAGRIECWSSSFMVWAGYQRVVALSVYRLGDGLYARAM